MGILNTTPDSVSDGERYLTLDAQLERARELVAAGADLIDVGGESGRTDRAAVSEDDEIARVLPLVEALAADGVLGVGRHLEAAEWRARWSTRARRC